ncbi:bifunctional DNA-binding transcriptional regulator/O6-methylguanine-DNA methyltransferase Ada [Teichococcus rhizosphaerae]|nr:bifunctional DNA-binding transcriptional regulator/O6-methylguanine-DNA methyltransferase Ada [Pseudoroseomonas rhizosphaerae]
MSTDTETHMDSRTEFLWAALESRQPRPGMLYAVTTQGVYCRFGCPSRLPLKRNVRFFTGCAEAEAAGFRACRRCDPRGERAALQAEAVRAACALIEQAESLPPLAALAARAGYARHHFLRLFREVTGLTPGAYADAVKARRLRAALADGARVADAVAGAGFGSESRVYEKPGRLLGMTPGAARRGGAGEEIRYAFTPSPLGLLLVARTEKGLCRIAFGPDEATLEGELAARFPRARLLPGGAGMAAELAAVVGLIEEPRAARALPLDLRGTAFQHRVWQALAEIPPGQTTTYSELAARIGQPSAVRAVAAACGANPAALAVPCHRVIGWDGSLTGYRWGLPRKRALLDREAAG